MRAVPDGIHGSFDRVEIIGLGHFAILRHFQETIQSALIGGILGLHGLDRGGGGRSSCGRRRRRRCNAAAIHDGD